MNERIKELALQARNYALDEKRIYERMHNTEQCMEEYREVYNEKFAELIVRECLSIVKSNTYGPNGEYDYSYSDEDSAADRRAETIYEEIAYRFGVAE
jgi:hypothetical protein